MFTGLVEEVGRIKSVTRVGTDWRLTVAAEKVLTDTKPGDSIAVNGICLTIVRIDKNTFAADVMPETLRRSSLEQLRENSPVNLERALRLGDRLGGHLVSGHIDGTGTLVSWLPEKNAIILRLQASGDLLRYIVKKGAVALDGVSLTVMSVDSEGFAVSIIPHSAGMTIIGGYRPGDRINIECDMIGKYVEKLLQPPSSGGEKITMAFLEENGF